MFVAHTNTSFVGLTHSNSFGPWVPDSGAIDNDIYVPRSSFNLLFISRLIRSLDCVISFTKCFIFLQDQSLGQMIGIRCESHALYHLRTCAHDCTVMDSQSFLYA